SAGANHLDVAPAVWARSIHSKPRFSISWGAARRSVLGSQERSVGISSSSEDSVGTQGPNRCEGVNCNPVPEAGQHPRRLFLRRASGSSETFPREAPRAPTDRREKVDSRVSDRI